MTHTEIQARQELGIAVDSKEVFGRRAATFDKLVEDRVALKELQTQTEAELKAIDEKLKLYLADTETKTVVSGTVKVTQCQGNNSSIKKELLVEKGVPATLIAECTVHKGYSYILVTRPKEK